MSGLLEGTDGAPSAPAGPAAAGTHGDGPAGDGGPCDFRAAFHAAPVALAVVDAAGRVREANPALESLLGAEPGGLHALPVADLAGGPAGGDAPRVRRLKHATGRSVWAEADLVPAGDTGDTLLTLLDVSELLSTRDELRHLRMYDPVTHLPNRALFFERLAAALADSATGRVGLCSLDLDGFKAVNDTLGHRAGDLLLEIAARRLERCAEDGGHLVARLGGDEFALLVESSTGTAQVTALADAILRTLARPYDLDGQRVTLTASVGVVERETAGSSATCLMQAADTTLYWAKADGRGRRTLFDPERNAHRMTRQALTSELREAIEGGEFTLDYQPIVGLEDEALHGVEALVRWEHPQFGRLGPAEFIGLAEDNGAIVPLGRWVLERACRQAREWNEARTGRPVFVSVNVAVRQVWDSDLVADVRRILAETGLPSGLLQLELTESAVMGSGGRPQQALQALSDMGVRIAIDDFGTGYSNLAYLSRLPVRALKLDGSFVRGFRTARDHNPADETIVTALVDLAHRLGLTVTAECVENPAQAERLRRIGCDTGQGWHFARPLSPDRVTALLGA